MVKKLIFFIGNSMANPCLTSDVEDKEFNDSCQNNLSGDQFACAIVLNLWQNFPVTLLKIALRFLLKCERFRVLFLYKWFLKPVCFHKASLRFSTKSINSLTKY